MKSYKKVSTSHCASIDDEQQLKVKDALYEYPKYKPNSRIFVVSPYMPTECLEPSQTFSTKLSEKIVNN